MPSTVIGAARRGPTEPLEALSVLKRAQVLASAALAVVMGLAPHVLHHAGPLAGAALFAGAIGSILFGAIGFVAAVPFLLRVHRRSGNWRLPAILLAAFIAMFSLQDTRHTTDAHA